MYIHITPRIYCDHSKLHQNCFKQIEIPELDIILTNKDNLTVKNPYPNKAYYVVCKRERKAIDGILIKTDKALTQFTVITKWSLAGKELIHTVNHIITDNDSGYDLLSDNTLIWNGLYGTEYENRKQPIHEKSDNLIQNCALFRTEQLNQYLNDDQTTNWESQEQTLYQPSLELSRLSSDFAKRTPSINTAFIA
ncbi:hypothetical protein TUM4438_31110 [Shewanella sairae]|uniref:Uncharacterized protein n=1 Tax=Shewanella sairae TaxID=190310 RepID=A0ABQ4PLM6_9GAMM|nr:DUF6012 family protein [Shewanella sairae]MCL1131881.1 DUF6012 family protein [Shewanella sairae]GIU48836.1 hypothetical protein TUM4438_31110 [Shewanella sairae]